MIGIHTHGIITLFAQVISNKIDTIEIVAVREEEEYFFGLQLMVSLVKYKGRKRVVTKIQRGMLF